MATRVLVADDQQQVREALSAIVEADPGLELVGAGADADAAIALATGLRPDVALLDFKMPGGGGPRAAREIRRLSPGTRVVAFSAYADQGSVLEMLRAGAIGYLVKSASMDEIRQTIALAARGEGTLSTGVTTDVVHELASRLEQQSQVDATERERVERIRSALESGSIAIALQPIIVLDSRRVVGYEALSRFRLEPSRSPDLWFAEAREVGLQAELETEALRLALETLDGIPAEAFLSVNVGPDCLLSPAVQAVLGEFDLSRVVLELTEHAQVDDYDALVHPLLKLRAKGVRVAVDDAGAGFASLRHVLRLAPDMLKIDGALIRGIEHDSAHRALTAALATFAQKLEIGVVAEGIESECSIESLIELGIDYGQGYALGMPAEQLSEAA